MPLTFDEFRQARKTRMYVNELIEQAIKKATCDNTPYLDIGGLSEEKRDELMDLYTSLGYEVLLEGTTNTLRIMFYSAQNP